MFYSTPNECFKTVFTFSVLKLEKKYLPFKVFTPPIGWFDFTQAWQNFNKKKSKNNPGLRGAGGIFVQPYIPRSLNLAITNNF